MSVEINGDVTTRVSTLEGRWKQTDARLEHLDGRVSSLAVDMASIKADVHTIVKGLDTLSSRASQPTNWIGLGSLIITLIVVGAQYVDLRLAPISAGVEQNRVGIHEVRDVISERGELLSEYIARVDTLEGERAGIRATESRVDALESQAAAAVVSRRAIGDYLQELSDRVAQ